MDESTNGVFVNDERVEGTRLLARGDVIRVGTEEFRFYADVAAVIAPSAPAPPPAAAARPAPLPLSEEPTTLPTQEPKAVARPPRPVLAELEFLNEGLTKGLRIEIYEALAHIGRGEHNDVLLANDSVSDSHAKLQRREDGWYLVDAGSTNGTFVGGVRLTGERRLEGRPNAVRRRARCGFSRRPAPPAAVAGHPACRNGFPASGSSATGRPGTGVPRWVWIVVALVVVAGAVYFLKA